MRSFRHIAIVIAGATFASACALPAYAQSWPTRPIEWIVPFAAGGSTDVLARLVADRLKERLGQPVVVVNRPGANSDIGYKAAAAAPPDGYTIVLTVPSVVTNPFQLKAALNPSRLAPVIYLAEGPYVLLAPKAFAPATVPELVTAMRAKRDAVSCAMTGGSGSLACQMLEYFAKAKMLLVPYRGVGPATTALLAGEIDLLFSFSISANAPMESGRVKALATTAPARGALPFPQLPTVGETLSDFEILGWSAVSVAAATPPDIIGRLNREMNAVLKEPGVSKGLEKVGLRPVGGTPEDFARRLELVQRSYGTVLEAAGVKPE
ncbi:MAG: tripartite tricarboxylate transporter substrate binding protein [Hyphomicrobiales bacterium]|nr:tripartite tricarboxylate transporter substrate binding protein [Hyphomicrobiales bacterium]